MLTDLQQIEASLARLARLRPLPAMVAATPRELAVLQVVDRGGLVTVGEIAARLALHPSRASRLVKSALRRGLLLRHASQRDGRRVELQLTAQGRKWSRSAAALRQRNLVRALRGFPPTERRQLAALLIRLAGALETAEGAQRGGPPLAEAAHGQQ